MKIILVDPNLVRTFLVIIFLILIMVCTFENNYFLMRTKLGYLRYFTILVWSTVHKELIKKMNSLNRDIRIQYWSKSLPRQSFRWLQNVFQKYYSKQGDSHTIPDGDTVTI